MSSRSKFTLLVCFVFALVAEAIAPVSAQSSSSSECAAQCGTTFGDGTRADRARQELLHDARHPFAANVSCGEVIGEAITASFLYTHYTPVSYELNTAHFLLRLEEWRCGILRFNMSPSCDQEWYLITGYKYREPPIWECQSTLERTATETHCGSLLNQSCGNLSSSTKLVCQYSLRNVLNFAEAEMCIMSQSAGHLAAETCIEGNVPGMQHCIPMDCTYPEADGKGECISWHGTEIDGTWTPRSATFNFSNEFGSATATSRFSLAELAALPEPRHSVIALSNSSRSALLSLCIDSLESGWLRSTLNIAQFRIVTRTMQFWDNANSSKTFNTNCTADEALCNKKIGGFNSQCSVNISALHPATLYSYEVNWQVTSINAVSPWSTTSRGTFRMPEAVPESSPTFANGLFSEANCSAQCWRRNRSSAFCTETVIYWKRISESKRNGQLTRILLYDSLNRTTSLPMNSTSYTMCPTGEEGEGEYNEDAKKKNHAAEHVHFRLTAENGAGIPDQSKWTEIRIPLHSHRLRPVSDIVVRRESISGSVQLWWRYSHPVDTFTIFWLDEELQQEPMWITKRRSQLRIVGSDKWTYILNEDHFRTSNATTAKRYGIGAAYNNQSSGIVFSSPCAFYGGDRAPEVEVIGNVVSGSTTVRVDVQLAASYTADPCSFAGPVLRLQAALLDDSESAAGASSSADGRGGARFSSALCDGCEPLPPLPLGDVARSLLVVGLTSNRKYVIAFRSVVHAGGEELASPYSQPVYARTLGLAGDEAAGVGVATAASIALLGAAALLLVRCHRQLGFGQKVKVPLIRHCGARATAGGGGNFHGGSVGRRQRGIPLHPYDQAEAKTFITEDGYSVIPVAECSQHDDDAGICAGGGLGACSPRIHKFIDLCTHDSRATGDKLHDEFEEEKAGQQERQLQQIGVEMRQRNETYADLGASDGKDSDKAERKCVQLCGETSQGLPNDNITTKLACLNCAEYNGEGIVLKDICSRCLLEGLWEGGLPATRCLISKRCLDHSSLDSEAKSSGASSSSLDYLRVSDLHDSQS